MTLPTDRGAVLRLDARGLAAALAQGHPVRPEELVDFEYRGISLNLPGLVERLTWKTFVKAFVRDGATGQLRGWNVRLRQEGIDGPVTPLLRGGEPFCFGPFAILAHDGRGAPRPCAPGVLLDYGQGSRKLDPTRALRDPLVALRPGDPTFLLGWSYVALGGLTFGTPSFFLLERLGPPRHVPRLD